MNNADAKMLRFQELMAEFLENQRQVVSALLTRERARMPASIQAVSYDAVVPGGFPFDELDRSLPARFALRAYPLPAPPLAGLAPGTIAITVDGRGIAERLAQLLASRGRRVVLMTSTEGGGDPKPDAIRVDFSSSEDVQRALGEVRTSHGPVAALVHLLPLREDVPDVCNRPAAAADALADARALFLMIKGLRADLEEAARNGGSALIGVSSLGGAFSSDPAYRPGSFSPAGGAVTGLLKAFAVETEGIRVRTVDLDGQNDDGQLAEQLAVELFAGDELSEVGYADGRRVTLRPTPRIAADGSQVRPASDWVWLVTGGARGITADICLELAERTQPTLILVGQSAEPAAIEQGPTAGVDGPGELKAIILTQLKATGASVTPALVEEAYRRLQREREIRANLAALIEAGARVRYFSLDVRNESALEALIHDVYETYGRLDGVIHGAGIIEDKLIKDKTVDSFERVFSTKVTSAFVLLRTLRLESLRTLVFFSSVAGRFGNRGQGDYGAANEVLNKLAVYVSGRSAARVVSLNWGPWDKRGMVSEDIKREFSRRGIELIGAQGGKTTFFEELTASPADVEVVVGDGPWRESSIDEPFGVDLPLMAHAETHATDGCVDVIRSLNPAVDRYLVDHCLDGKPVLPLAVAAELMVEAVQQAYPGRVAVTIENCRLLRGIVLDDGPAVLRIAAHPSPSQSHELRLDVTLSVEDATRGVRYRSTIVLADALEWAGPYIAPDGPARSFPLTASDCYRQWLFHGPRFQRITRLEVFDWGMRAALVTAHANTCIEGIDRPEWIVDPLTLDVAPQMAALWSRATGDSIALPIGFDSYQRFQTSEKHPAVCVFVVRESGADASMVADAYFLTSGGEVAGVLSGLECMRARSLNRLSGQASSEPLVPVTQ